MTHSRAVRFLVAVVAAVVWLVVGAQQAAAHAELLDTVPAPGTVVSVAPAEVELRFNEPVRPVDGASILFFGDAEPVVLPARAVDGTVTIDLPPDLTSGTHVVGYRVTSADGHPVGGALTFHLGAPGGAPAVAEWGSTPSGTEALFAGLTIAQYLGLLGFGGLLAFDVLVLAGRARMQPAMGRVRTGALVIATAASVVAVPVAALRVTGAAAWQLVTPGAWWAGLTLPTVQAAALVVAAGWGAHVLARDPRRRRGGVALLLAAAAVAGPVLVGHTRTVDPGWAMMAADVGHLVAAAWWLGGLAGLVGHLVVARTGRDPVLAVALVRRFSAVAALAIVLLLLSGGVMGVLVVGSADALVGTSYGRLLLLKLGVVGSVLVLASWNRWRLLPRVTRQPTSEAGWSALARILRYEAALLVAVVGITGLLSTTSPTHQHAPVVGQAAVQLRAASQGLTVDGEISPGLLGANQLSFRLTFNDAAVTPEDVTVSVRLPSQGLGPLLAEPVLLADGAYDVEVMLPVAGEWELQVSARVSRFEQPIVLLPVTVR